MTTAALGGVEAQLADIEAKLFGLLTAIGSDDKKSAMKLLGPVAVNNTAALRAITLWRAGQFAAAEDVIADAKRSLLEDMKP